MNVYQKERLLQIVCDVIDRTLKGRSKTVGGYVAGCCVIVTLDNAYFANSVECQMICAATEWIGIVSCPGAIIFVDVEGQANNNGNPKSWRVLQ